jgi:hypothetical protein
MSKCLICSKEFKNGGVLARHLIVDHKLDYRGYYHGYVLKSNDVPKCKCGCGKEMRWTSMDYTEFAKGHYSRVHNNWGHNPEAVKRSAETRRQQFASGQRKVWNSGLTKETNDIVKEYGEQCSQRFTPEIRKEYSERMKSLREDGKIVPLHGPQHSQWKGGTSSVSMLIYNDVGFYREWKFPILCRDEFKCVECGSNKNLHVHHDGEMLSEIIGRHMVDDMSVIEYDIKRFIADAVVDYHITNKVSGVTLCRECHGKIHPSLNFV